LRQPWRRVLPGAIAATAMWFLTTLSFGWYVTRFANYTQVYGSLGAGIALLFWLYIVSLSVLCGAEFNEQFRLHIHHDESAEKHNDESEKQSKSTV
jgi:membrane protein